MLFLQRYVERDIRSAHPPQKISKSSLFFNFLINQTFYAENTANLQNRAGQDFFGGVQPSQIKFHWNCSVYCMYDLMREIHPHTYMLRESLRESILWFSSKVRPCYKVRTVKCRSVGHGFSVGDELCHLNEIAVIVLYSVLKSVCGGLCDGSALCWPHKVYVTRYSKRTLLHLLQVTGLVWKVGLLFSRSTQQSFQVKRFNMIGCKLWLNPCW